MDLDIQDYTARTDQKPLFFDLSGYNFGSLGGIEINLWE